MIDWGRFWSFFRTGIPPEILNVSIFITVAVIAIGICSTSVENKKRFSVWVVLVEYLFVVVCSTVICRDVQNFEFDRLEIVPFWTYKAVLTQVYGVSIWDIVLNVILFIPLGSLIKFLYPSLSVWKVVIVAVSFSVCIEINQYIFEKGVAQTDDVMHNLFGALLGWWFAGFLLNLCRKFEYEIG